MLGRLKWPLVITVPLGLVAVAVVCAGLIRTPVAADKLRDCLHLARLHHLTSASCQTTESLLDRAFSDPVVYFTGWLTIFTAVLAGVGVAQGLLVFDQIRLAREEFNATHRPRVIARAFQITSSYDLNAGEEVRAIFAAQNIGESAAILEEIRCGTIVLPAQERLPGNLGFPFREALTYTLECGVSELIPLNGGAALEGNEGMEIYAGDKALYFLGTLAYVDRDRKTRRLTGFCRRYLPRDQRWETVESEYEYSS